jgi:hypothetical protein
VALEELTGCFALGGAGQLVGAAFGVPWIGVDDFDFVLVL